MCNYLVCKLMLVKEYFIFMKKNYFIFFFLEILEDLCFLIFSFKNEMLFLGCVINGINIIIVDVGKCELVKCVKGNFSFNFLCMDFFMCCGFCLIESVLV